MAESLATSIACDGSADLLERGGIGHGVRPPPPGIRALHAGFRRGPSLSAGRCRGKLEEVDPSFGWSWRCAFGTSRAPDDANSMGPHWFVCVHLERVGSRTPPPAKWTGHLARFVRRRIGPTFGAPKSTLNSSAEGVTITRSRSSTPCEGPTASDAANKALAAAAKRSQPEEPSAARARIAS